MREQQHLEREVEILNALLLEMQRKIQYYELQITTLTRSMGFCIMVRDDVRLIQQQLDKYLERTRKTIKIKEQLKTYLNEIIEQMEQIRVD